MTHTAVLTIGERPGGEREAYRGDPGVHTAGPAGSQAQGSGRSHPSATPHHRAGHAPKTAHESDHTGPSDVNGASLSCCPA